MSTLFENQAPHPLADRLRPRRLGDIVGQDHLLGPEGPIGRMVASKRLASMILWGPPGCGKTTIARLLAEGTDLAFEPLSAVFSGVADLRKVFDAAKKRRAMGQGTLLFVDEIHRFNRAQQDAFLPYVEDGSVIHDGATTENPSFELNSALLSRLRVFVLQPLAPEAIRAIVERALAKLAAESGKPAPPLSEAALELLVRHADGDARRALNATEALLDHVLRDRKRAAGAEVSVETVAAVLERRLAQYDKAGEHHFNLISALHKAVRGSDVEGALYWLARMIDGGEDVLYLARRVVRMAVEDIGLADPRALSIALAAKDAYHFLGSPEGDLAIAEAVIYLAAAPKSNKVYSAWNEAQQAARDHPAEPVPLHIRNAPTALMKGLGYGAGYRYDHAEESAHAAGQEYLPEPLRGARWYEPTDAGYEKTLAERLAWLAQRKSEK